MGMDNGSLAVYAGVFPSEQAAADFFQLTDGVPVRLYNEMYLQGDFCGKIEIKFFDKSSNKAEDLFADFPYGENIVGMLRAFRCDKMPRKMNTAVIIYDFYLGDHFTGHNLKQMKQKKGEDYSVFHISDIVHYEAPQYLEEHPEYKGNF